MISDLFGHKLHVTLPDWPDKVVELAQIFSAFDGHAYDRASIEERLKTISPRSAYVARDPSKFRDEISAYPLYLGLYYLELMEHQWVFRLTESTKQFLLKEAPDVGSFLRIQLSLFQFPNPSGSAYQPSGTLRLQRNAAEKTLSYVEAGIHLSPLRLICCAVLADAQLRNVPLKDARVGFAEIYSIANSSEINYAACPDIEAVANALERCRAGVLQPPARFERRFRILEHTGLFELRRGAVAPASTISTEDEDDIRTKIQCIANIADQFEEFDDARNVGELKDAIATGKWGQYFDGARTLQKRTLDILGSDMAEMMYLGMPVPPQLGPVAYDLQERPVRMPPPQKWDRASELQDPEVTRIRRERSSLKHKTLVDNVDEILRRVGSTPKYSQHIDLYADIPGDGAFLFEAKSGGGNLLGQVRKGLSQLYEYRYRYANQVSEDVRLCLVLDEDPTHISWLVGFLCEDRGVLVCWFDDEWALHYPSTCHAIMKVLDVQPQTVSSENCSDITTT